MACIESSAEPVGFIGPALGSMSCSMEINGRLFLRADVSRKTDGENNAGRCIDGIKRQMSQIFTALEDV